MKTKLSKCCGAKKIFPVYRTEEAKFVNGLTEFCSKCFKIINEAFTQHDKECKGCGGVNCKTKVVK